MNDSLSLDQLTGSVVLSSRLIFRCFTLMMLEIGDIWKIFSLSENFKSIIGVTNLNACLSHLSL